jgi:hypothetical protein
MNIRKYKDWSNNSKNENLDFFENYSKGRKYNDSEEDDMQHLLYLLRTMFRNSGIEECYIESKGMDIYITVEMRRRERLKDIIKVFEVANKLKKDILAQYDSEFEMWETKEGNPLFEFCFYYGEGLDNDKEPF